MSLRVSARTFSVTPKVGDPTAGRLGAVLDRVVGDLKGTVLLLEDGPRRVCLIGSSAHTDTVELKQVVITAANELLGVKAEEVITVSSHNHCTPLFVTNGTIAWNRMPGAAPKGKLNSVGEAFMAALREAMKALPGALTPVKVEWGKASERRFTYNRRGRRPDGKPYFIREEDRVQLDPSYVGEIDPEATVVVFRGGDGKPVACLAHYTGHPVTAYNPEKMISFGEWPQIATELLSQHLGGVPVAFLQGCAGDINSKFLLCGTVEQSREFGGYLGEAFIKALSSLKPSARDDLQAAHVTAQIPHNELPSLADLERDLAQINDFIRRGNAGDEDTLACVGMNFPKALTPPYRAKLVDMVRPWYEWAIAARREGRLADVPKFTPLDVTVARFGDVGFVGLPFEPFVKTGLKIKREAPVPCVLPCGYCGGENGYIPDASAVDDREYMGGFFRYTRFRPPYRAPGGDAAAEAGLATLKRLSA